MNKCTECPDNNYYRDVNGNGLCILDPKRVNAYGCEDILLGNNAEEITNYPVDDLTDKL